MGKPHWSAGTSWATELVINESQIQGYWTDAKGLVPGGQHRATYALVMIPLTSVPADLNGSLEDIPAGLLSWPTGE